MSKTNGAASFYARMEKAGKDAARSIGTAYRAVSVAVPGVALKQGLERAKTALDKLTKK